jgi:hypothetical protein
MIDEKIYKGIPSPQDFIKLNILQWYFDIAYHLAKVEAGIKRGVNFLSFKAKARQLLLMCYAWVLMSKKDSLIELYDETMKLLDKTTDLKDAYEVFKNITLLLRILGITKVETIELDPLLRLKLER